MGGIGVILNPYARGNRRDPGRAQRFSAILGDDGEVRATKDLDELEAALRDFHDHGVKVLAVCGGDGSLYHVVSRAVRIWGEANLPPFSIISGGTINNIARTLGIRRSRPAAALSQLVANHRRGRPHLLKSRQLLIINGSDYGYIVGAGAVVNFLNLYYGWGKRGSVGALVLFVTLGLSWILRTGLIKRVMQPIEADILCDGQRLPFDQFTILIGSSITHLGLGVKPFYLSDKEAGAYHFIAGTSTAGQLLSRLWCFFRGRPCGLDSLYDGSARSVSIRFAVPQAITINGEILDSVDELRLEAGPRLAFICG